MRAESGELLKILSIRVLDLAVILVGFVIWGGGGGGGGGGGHRDCCHGLVGRHWSRRGNLYGI